MYKYINMYKYIIIILFLNMYKYITKKKTLESKMNGPYCPYYLSVDGVAFC